MIGPATGSERRASRLALGFAGWPFRKSRPSNAVRRNGSVQTSNPYWPPRATAESESCWFLRKARAVLRNRVYCKP